MKAVFFDFGGTLADIKERYWSGLANDMSRLLGIPCDEARKVLRTEMCVTPGAEELELLKKKCRENGVPEENAEEYRDIQLSSLQRFEWEPNAIEVMKELKERGVVTGIITNTDGWGIRVYDILKPDIRPHVDTMVYSCEERTAKPETRVFELALERTGIEAEEAMYVGDKEDRDVEAPHKLGMKAVLYDPRGKSENSKADRVIKDLKEVLGLI